MKWLNPLNWGALALQIVGGLIAAVLLYLYVDSKLEEHYTAEIKAEVKAATDKAQAAATVRKLENETRKTEALNAKVKTLETVVANGKRVAAADGGLSDALRASTAARTDITACQQRADTLDTVQLAIRGFTQRVVQECDRHVADKEALIWAWPK